MSWQTGNEKNPGCLGYVGDDTSIPLSTTMDATELRKGCKNSKTGGTKIKLVHDYSGVCDTCSYNYDGCKSSSGEYIPENCPCREADLQNICFGTVLALGHEHLKGDVQHISPEQWLVCTDHENVLAPVCTTEYKKMTGLYGWSQLQTAKDILRALSTLYWYRISADKNFIRKTIVDLTEGYTVDGAKRRVAHSLHSVNAILVKLFTSFPKEIQHLGYVGLAQATSRLFCELLHEYGLPYHSEPLGDALWVDWDNCPSTGLRMLFEHALDEYSQDIYEEFQSNAHDGTETVEHFARMVPLAQNRGLGYLPACESRKVIEEYISNGDLPRQRCSKEKAQALNNQMAKYCQDRDYNKPLWGSLLTNQ